MDSVQNPDTALFRFGGGLPDPLPIWTGLPRYNFVGGHNDPDNIPVGELADAAARALRAHARHLAIYNLGTGPFGFEGLRDGIAVRLAKRGMKVGRDRVFVTSGSGQGLDLVNAALLEPGDAVILEELTYSGALNKVRKLGAQVAGAPLDSHGLDVYRLGQMLDTMVRQGVRPKYIYTIPTVQNPTGSILSEDRRRRLVELARHYHVPIFEDECYAELAFTEAPPALAALAPDAVIHIGSFSKTLAPALRLGYIVAEPHVLRRIGALKSDGGTGAIDQMVAAEYLATGYSGHVETLVAALRRKLAVMVEAIEREFGTAVEIVHPEGGIFIWLRFPDDLDVRRLIAPAARRGVVFNPGPEWACDPEKAKNVMRLCFALPGEDDIRAGVAELAAACHEVAGYPERSGNMARSTA
ncbi:PLP-dependent aminotransferase family protein [Mesorhizobium australicum]|uniref:2-aminoadipate transaminase n=1 Tax=Mesorhizobium australicum TaxID=536018 RepID=A0A1X7MW92_9HYPH|nr:PLP-dependent aminotransferase family protein [Mesorhizobium australicum]SMH28214.1 2-aminoadipate transaminase [Mesorhizobium australicum]